MRQRPGDISVPASVEVRDSPPTRLSVLVYESPFHPMATPDPSHYDHLRELMESAMVNVSYVELVGWPQISDSLDQFDVVILGAGARGARIRTSSRTTSGPAGTSWSSPAGPGAAARWTGRTG